MTRAHAGIAIAILLVSSGAEATLGEHVSTVEIDRTRLNGAHRTIQASGARFEAHLITLADGSAIHEYVAPNGIVFAVSWSTRLKPRLETLLGAQAPRYAAAASAAMARPGIRHGVSLSDGDLVVQANAHLNAHTGIAWLRSLVPQGVRIDDLR